MSRPKIAVFAYSEVGAACLEELVKNGANVAHVYTHDDDPDETIWFRSVREIAERAGFGAVNTLYRVFKKHKGVPPATWRRENQAKQTK